MKFLKNNLGISLVESLVAMGLTAAAGVAYMSHMKNVAKNDADQKIRASLDNLAFEATTYLQSRDICTANFTQAFRNQQIPATGSILSKSGFASLLGKPIQDSSGGTFQPVIFEPRKSFDANRIYVDKVKYELLEISPISIPSSPWNRSAKLAITVEFVTCRQGSAAKTDGLLSTLICPAELQRRISKRIERMAAFKVNSNNKIEGLDLTVPPGKPKLACADSQDALVDEARKYTNEKVCRLEARMLANMGKEGITSCNYKVSLLSNSHSTPNAGVSSFTLPTKFVLNTLRYRISGAGGGGGGGDRNEAGGGGYKGELKDGEFPNDFAGAVVTLTSGAGGSIGDGAAEGKPGGPGAQSIIRVTSKSFTMTANGGGGGCGECHGNNGTAGEASVFGSGGHGAGPKNDGGTGAPGAGGGGGGDKWGEGGRGGYGKIEISWKVAEVKDADGQIVDLDAVDGFVDGSGTTTGGLTPPTTTGGSIGGGGGGPIYTTSGGSSGGGRPRELELLPAE